MEIGKNILTEMQLQFDFHLILVGKIGVQIYANWASRQVFKLIIDFLSFLTMNPYFTSIWKEYAFLCFWSWISSKKTFFLTPPLTICYIFHVYFSFCCRVGRFRCRLSFLICWISFFNCGFPSFDCGFPSFDCGLSLFCWDFSFFYCRFIICICRILFDYCRSALGYCRLHRLSHGIHPSSRSSFTYFLRSWLCYCFSFRNGFNCCFFTFGRTLITSFTL